MTEFNLNNIEGVTPTGVLAIEVNDESIVGTARVVSSGEGLGLQEVQKVRYEAVFPTDFDTKEDGSLVTIEDIKENLDTEAVDEAEENGSHVTFEGLFTATQVEEIISKLIETKDSDGDEEEQLID